ncbi:hypothetical protein P7C70_g1165, partial [Phenoliferia sp. Uapishka_3]
MHHVVALLIPAWGHVVSYIPLATRMLEADSSLVITLVQHALLVAQMESELALFEYDHARLKVVALGDPNVPFGPTAIKVSFQQLIGGWIELLPKLMTPQEGAWPPPQAMHLDFFAGGPCLEAMKALAPNVKLLDWFSAAAVSMIAHFSEHDYAALAQSIHQDEKRSKGRSYDEILSDVVAASNGTDKLNGSVVRLPGAPEMYDWETHAHATGPPEGIGGLLAAAQAFAKAADGYILVASSATEPEGVSQTREYYEKLGKKVFCVGPQLHDSYWGGAPSSKVSSEKVAKFLYAAEAKYGPKSVLFVSFGSLFFPVTTPHLVAALVETLLTLDAPFPFIFALGGKMASLPAELIERVNSSGKGLICHFWVEQRAILQSGTIGWFLSHGGWNGPSSVSESVSQGIPLILWPANAEQPMNAAILSNGSKAVAFELLQVIGSVKGPFSASTHEFKDVFKKARGEEGKRLRANVERMAQDLRDSRKDEGQAEIERLVAFCS